jgi:crotonobetainyl-CoA:carnitine CoA-transferase CaiB-like acyl-CoA transferase
VLTDPQVLANGYLQPGEGPGPAMRAVSSPAQFDGRPLGPVPRAPEHGQHTEELLLEHGYSWEQITAMKDADTII